MAVGILALQGGFDAHRKTVESLGFEAFSVRSAEELERAERLIIPGGESTVMTRLLRRFGLLTLLRERIAAGMPVFGTCAGMILLSSGVAGSDQETLGAIDIEVARNAYGRQSESFETPLNWGSQILPALFIRAPRITYRGKGVEVLVSFEDAPVLVRQGSCLAASFHPELTGYKSVHRYFLNEMDLGTEDQ
ncbi:MAG: pyridoxal 5'-phosphate synthase glutaminase subunit PdxT [Spirochaetales bacterium]|nr:pyridoxal 5'-phosphate synthase glutaminase subunit PdxT [Spirochaetales bacterium]